MLKWPNDLMLAGSKLAGILLERSSARVAVGFGVNLAAAPQLSDRETASLEGVCLPQAFAPLLAGSFARLLELWRRSDPALIGRAWMARAHPTGTKLTVRGNSEHKLVGVFDGLEADGALRLRDAGGTVQTVHAGDIEL